MEIILGIATLLGGITALWFFWDKYQGSAPFRNLVSEEYNKEKIGRELEGNVIRVGFFKYSPLIDCNNFNSNSPELFGIYPDLMRIVADKYGLDIKYVPLKISECIEAINNDEIDIVLCVFQTLKRTQFVDFTAILHRVIVTGVVNIDENRLASASDLHDENIRIVTCRGEIGAEFSEQLGVSKHKGRYVEIDTSNISDVMDMVVSGKADVALADGIFCKRYIKENEKSGLKVIFSEYPIEVCQNGVMLKEGQPVFREWLNTEFREARETPAIKKIEKELLKEWEGIVERF